MIQFHAAQSRGAFQNNWLNTRYSFSFSNWYNPEKMGVGPLRVLNDDIIAPRGGFPMHSHENMEIITIVLSGSIAHKDSMGNDKIINSGEIQVMSAGTGVTHSEFNPSATEELRLFQTWLLPNTLHVAPRYDQKSFIETLNTEGIHPIVSGKHDDTLFIYQNAIISLGNLKAGQTYTHASTYKLLYIMCISGNLVVNSQTLQDKDAMVIQDENIISFIPTDDSKILMYEL